MSAAFQHMVTLLSFVLALGVSHQLFTLVEMVRAGDRVKHSWVHTVWMADCFLAVITWWVGIWDFHALPNWSIYSIIVNLIAALAVFLAVAFVCPRVPETGTLDLAEFHRDNHRKYAGFTFVEMVVGVGMALYYGNVDGVPGQNLQAAIIAPMAVAALAAMFVPNATVQRVAPVFILIGIASFLFIGDPVLSN